MALRDSFAVGLIGSSALLLSSAHADIAAPPGQTRVAYSFQVDSIPDGYALVASPVYNSKEQDGWFARLEAGKSVSPFQGATPAIYLMTPDEAASLAGKKSDEVEKFVTAHGKLCLKKVPRVFEVPSSTGVQKINDVIDVSPTKGSCQATLAKTVYGSADGKSGDGTVDAQGHRLPPAPFGKDLPDVTEAGFDNPGPRAPADSATPPAISAAPSSTSASLTAPASSSSTSVPPAPPQKNGCSGCEIGSGESSGIWVGLGALALAAVAVPRRRNASRRR